MILALTQKVLEQLRLFVSLFETGTHVSNLPALNVPARPA